MDILTKNSLKEFSLRKDSKGHNAYKKKKKKSGKKSNYYETENKKKKDEGWNRTPGKAP